jgi:uncharacterized protein (UPF0264 family)
MSQLLISVRDAAEAKSALAGGADLIDVKEPANGPLGRADPPIIEDVIRTVAGRAPVSAACGELELCPRPLPAGLAFAKFGLAGWRDRNWPGAWSIVRSRLPSGCAPVAVAYADWQTCDAPPPHEVAGMAIEQRFGAFLIDTFEKNGATLLDRMSRLDIAELTRRCRGAGVPIALAGSLGLPQIQQLRELNLDWFAVRGAACFRDRGSAISTEKVQLLKAEISTTSPPNHPTTFLDHPDAFIAGGSVIKNSRPIRSA